MECGGGIKNLYERCKPYLIMVGLQFGYAGMNIITKISLNNGMSEYILVVYRYAFATATIAPFAIVLERKVRPKMTFMVFLQIFGLALLGPVDQIIYYSGLKLTSPTYSCALSNMLPAMAFVIAFICRMEKVDIKTVRCIAKVVGTLVTVGGAMLMTLYKGPIMEMVWAKHKDPTKSSKNPSASSADKDFVKGSILLMIATLAWASMFISQAVTLKKYPANLSLTAMICFVGTIQTIPVALLMEHSSSAWIIGWDMSLLAAAYGGIVTSGLAYYLQGLVMKNRGPVFVTAFTPLMMIIVAIFGSFILSEKIYLGGILGAFLIVAGLYAVLWGKLKDPIEKKTDIVTEVDSSIEENSKMSTLDIETEKEVYMDIAEGSSSPPVVIADSQESEIVSVDEEIKNPIIPHSEIEIVV